MVAAWLIWTGLSVIRAAAAGVGDFPLFAILVYVADKYPVFESIARALAMTEAAYLEARRRRNLYLTLAPPSAWLTSPEYATLRHLLENAHAAAEAPLAYSR